MTRFLPTMMPAPKASRSIVMGTLLCSLLAAGCSRSRQGEAVEAPRDFEAFLTWAAERLQEEPESVSLPGSGVVDELPRRWETIHLLDRLDGAAIESAWSPREESREALAVIENVSSRRVADNDAVRQRIARRATLEGEDAPVLILRGFNVPRERIGALLLRVRIPYGRHFVLEWGEAGRIAVPVPSHEEAFTLWIPTDGFAEWEGRLRRIRLVLDGHGDGEVRVHRLELIAKQTAYPRAVGVQRSKKNDDLRSALYMHAEGSAAFPIRVPPRARFHLGLAAEGAEPVHFQVLIEHGDRTHEISAQRIESAKGWIDARLSLERWSGEDVTLILRARSRGQDAVALWAEPIVYEAVEDPPIVVIYLIDTLASEHVQMYGYDRVTMPRLAAFAEGGVLFSNMVSNSSRTIESIPDLMFSMPTERHGVWHYLIQAPPEVVSLAEILRHAGFATVSFCTNVNAGPRQAMDQGFDRFIDKIGYWWTDVDRTVPLDDVSRWLEHHADRPTFLYVHTAEPHAPYSPPDGFSRRFDPGYEGRIDGTYDGDTGFRYTREPRDVEHVAALYDEEIVYADHRFGRFVDLLDERGVLDRAHVFVTSDHGEEFLEHANWEHGESLHNEQTRVPLVAAGPRFASGSGVDVPVQLYDVMPTVLDLFSLSPPHEVAGRSLLPLLTDPDVASHDTWTARTLYASNHFSRVAMSPSQQVVQYSAIEAGRWKILYGFQNLDGVEDEHPRFALYDLKHDPREREDVLADNEDIARRLIERLVSWRARQRPFERQDGPAMLSLDDAKALESLGYLGRGDGTP